MRSITQHYEGKNIYTRPLQGKPHYRNSGIIYAVDRSGNKYSVARVDLERFDDQNFQYVFTPDWDTIDSLPTSIFQGIHGLDMSMRLERYYRVNMMPYFISERTPSEKREDLWELLEEVGLDYGSFCGNGSGAILTIARLFTVHGFPPMVYRISTACTHRRREGWLAIQVIRVMRLSPISLR